MTLRSLFGEIKNFLSNLINGILDFDLTNILTFLGIILYIFYCIWIIKKGFKTLNKKYKISSTIKKIGLVTGFIFLILVVVVMPILILIDVFIVN